MPKGYTWKCSYRVGIFIAKLALWILLRHGFYVKTLTHVYHYHLRYYWRPIQLIIFFYHQTLPIYLHCRKSVLRSFFSPYFHAFGLNTERHGVSQSECRKYGPEKLRIRTIFTLCIRNLPLIQTDIFATPSTNPQIESFCHQIIRFMYTDHTVTQRSPRACLFRNIKCFLISV